MVNQQILDKKDRSFFSFKKSAEGRFFKRGELTLQTLVEAVLVAFALVVLFIISVGLYNLFFHDAAEQAAKQSFASLVARIELLQDNKPVQHTMLLPEGYAIMDTRAQGNCFIDVQYGDKAAQGMALFLQQLPQQCQGNECICLCRSEKVGLCNEIVECQAVKNHENNQYFEYLSKVDDRSLKTLRMKLQHTDPAAIYSCSYIDGAATAVIPLTIVKQNNEVLLCFNECDPNNPSCCQTANFEKKNNQAFAKLKQAYESCKQNTITATDPVNYFALLSNGVSAQQLVYLPYLSQQKALYRLSFDQSENLLPATIQRINLLQQKPFDSLSGDATTIVACSEVLDTLKSPDFRKTFVGSDGINRALELGTCSDGYIKQKYLRITRENLQQPLFVTTLSPAAFDLIFSGLVQLYLLDDQLFVVPLFLFPEFEEMYYTKSGNELGYSYAASASQNYKIDIRTAITTAVQLAAGHVLVINNNQIDIAENGFEKQQQFQLTTCDQLGQTNSLGEYVYVQEKETDLTRGNTFKTIIDFGSCKNPTLAPQQIEEEKQKISGKSCAVGDADCVGSYGSQEQRELEHDLTKLYLRVIIENDLGNRELRYKNEFIQNSADYINKRYYFYNDELYILEPTTKAILSVDQLPYSIDLHTKQKSDVQLFLKLEQLDNSQLSIKSSCSQLVYPFSSQTKLQIKASGEAELFSNNNLAATYKLDDLAYAADSVFCFLHNTDAPLDISQHEITFSEQQKLEFVDIGIDRLCVLVSSS